MAPGRITGFPHPGEICTKFFRKEKRMKKDKQ